MREKGKNSISLTGGVSGLEGSFVGIAYSTNNFLGLGETLSVQANVGNLERNIMLGFTEPYMFDRPLQLGFTVYYSSYNFNQARNAEILLGQQLNLPTDVLDTLQNFSQSSTGFTASLSYPLHRSFKRVGITYGFDIGTTTTFTTASTLYFQTLAFSGLSGPDALQGVITSKIVPNFTINTIDRAYGPTRGYSLYVGGEIAGLGGTVKYFRPVITYKRFKKVGRNIVGFNLQGSFLSGYGGLVAPPFQRFYAGGDNDLRGFDVRSISPVAFLPDHVFMTLTNPDGTPVLINPSNPRAGAVTIPIPIQRIIFPGGDTSLVGNFEYRIPIAGPVTVALFDDIGFDGVARQSQLRIDSGQLSLLDTTAFGCGSQGPFGACRGTTNINFPSDLKTVANTNWIPRMSTGVELQVMMPVINQPFRVYWAYNPLRLDTLTGTPQTFTRSMFPVGAAGDYTYQQAINLYSPAYLLREPRKTFRFTVSTTF